MKIPATDLLAIEIAESNLPPAAAEYQFSPGRKYRFDFAWPALMLAVEVEGGTWTQGRHTRGKGYEEDCRKYNLASIEGWKLLRFTSDMVKRGEAIKILRLMLKRSSIK